MALLTELYELNKKSSPGGERKLINKALKN
jgi:hypothetical protein